VLVISKARKFGGKFEAPGKLPAAGESRCEIRDEQVALNERLAIAKVETVAYRLRDRT
jgi:hypothetical protein